MLTTDDLDTAVARGIIIADQRQALLATKPEADYVPSPDEENFRFVRSFDDIFLSIGILLVIAVTAIFVAQNTEVVEVHFLFWTMAMSRALMLVFLVLIGIVIGWLLRGHVLRKSRRDKQNGM